MKGVPAAGVGAGAALIAMSAVSPEPVETPPIVVEPPAIEAPAVKTVTKEVLPDAVVKAWNDAYDSVNRRTKELMLGKLAETTKPENFARAIESLAKGAERGEWWKRDRESAASMYERLTQ